MIRFLLLFLMVSLLSAAEKNMLKIRIPNEEQSLELPKIEADENIRAEDRLQALPKGKEGTLSAAYPDHRKDYRWTPGWSLAGTGHLRIVDAAAVPDGSLIAFLESVGKKDGPQGARVVLLDVPRKRICGYFEVGRKLKALRLGSSLEYAAALAEEQESLKQGAGISVLNLAEGRETVFMPGVKPFAFALAGTVLFAAEADGTIRMTDLKDGSGRTLRSGPRPYLCVTPDGKTLLVVAEDAICRFDAKTGEVVAKEVLTEVLRIRSLVCMKPDGSAFAFASEPDSRGRHRIFFRVNGKQKEVAADSTGKMVWQERDGLFFLMRLIKGRISRMDLESLKQFSSCEPKSVRPGTLGTVLYLFSGSEPGELIVMDTLGAVYSLKSVGKRWRKAMMVEVGTR